MTTRRTSEVAPDLAFPARVHSFPTRRSSDLNDHGGGSDGDADERVEGHRGGQAQGLANHLVPLAARSEEHTSELQSHSDLVCRLLLEKKQDAIHPMKRRHHPANELSIARRTR